MSSDPTMSGSLRGSGRDASGPLIATWQMMEWIRDQGRPVSRDEVIEACAGFVDPGYARRWYARKLNGVRARLADEGPGSSTAGPRPPVGRRRPPAHASNVNTRTAQEQALKRILSKAAGSLLIRDGDMYTFVRMPTRTPGGMPVEQVTYNPHVQRRHVYEMELVQQLRKAQKRGVFTDRGKALTIPEREALMRWLSVFDVLQGDSITVNGAELDAITVLRAMRDRSDSTRAKQTTAEKRALEQLWRSLDNTAPKGTR